MSTPRRSRRPYLDARSAGLWLGGPHAEGTLEWVTYFTYRGLPFLCDTFDDTYRAPYDFHEAPDWQSRIGSS